MKMKTINEVAETYFNTLNPIAERISTDIIAIKDAYEGLWNNLSNKEKNQIINETVVHPEAILKYTLSSKSYEGGNLDIPLITSQMTGAKYIVDETTGVTWRDEHSAPFSWKTPSQIDLSIFTSSKDEKEIKEVKSDSYFINNRSKVKQNFSTDVDTVDGKFGAGNTFAKNPEKNDVKRSVSSCSPNVVLVGTCSKLSGLCSKLKFLPGKSYSYEVQTVVANPTASNEGGFLDKIKSSAVLKFQNTLKLVGGRSQSDKKVGSKDLENLMPSKLTATVVKVQKPSPKIAKPKSPPPPPPIAKPSQKIEESDENKEGKNMIFVKNLKNDKSYNDEYDSEKVTLLEENSVESFLSADAESLEQGMQTKVLHDMSDDFNSVSTECTPLSGPSTEVIPKSGFDFLDNW